ncbi:hypothetical protein vseg_009213 [Gypsophila vaccaria]
MRCKKHMNDYSSTIGVCASCLRIKLLSLIELQEQRSHSHSPIHFPPFSPNPNPNFNSTLQQQQNQPKIHPKIQQHEQLIFPRSVSPYITRRKSDQSQLFYATPQVNPPNPKRKGNSKFGLISKLFRSKSSASKSSASKSSSTTNSTLISHNSAPFTCRNKGMSPESEFSGDETADSTPARWAARPSPARGTRPSSARAASMAFCLSPLVRASPARTRRFWGEKSGLSGEVRVSSNNNNNNNNNESIKSNNGGSSNNNNKPSLANAASFCGNRSRKLVDFGKVNVNR